MDANDDAWIDAVARGALGGDRPTPARPEAEADPGEAIDVALLLDLRAGVLSDAEAARVEAALAADPEARALLRTLAEPVPPFLGAWGRREARRALGARRRWVAPLVGVALAAAAALFVLAPRGPSIPEYRIEAVRGVQAPIRGDDTARVDRGVVDPESVLVVALTPSGGPGDVAPVVRAFVEAPDGRLRDAAVAVQAGQGGALRFEAPVVRLFGGDFGVRRVWLAVGVDDDAFEGVDGRPADAARQATDLRWLPVEVDYREGVR